MILEPKKRKSVTTSTFSPSICHVVMGPEAMILDFLIFSLYREKQGIGRVGTREKHMEEVDMKVVHIKTIGEGRGEG